MISRMSLLFFLLINLVNFCFGANFLELFGNTLRNVPRKNVSEECFGQLQAYGSGILQREKWALQMIDAMSKIPSGILSGNIADIGVFDQCIESNNSEGSIQGKYCLGHVTLNLPQETQKLKKLKGEQLFRKLPLPEPLSNRDFAACRWAACFPSGCTGREFVDAISPAISKLIGSGSNITMEEMYCQTRNDAHPPLTVGAFITLSFLAVVTLLLIISTVYDIILSYTRPKACHGLLLSFSVLTNGRKIFNTNMKSEDQLPFIHGIKSISAICIIFSHTFSTYVYGPVSNMYEYFKWSDSIHSMYAFNATFSVETFLLITGTLLTYSYLKSRAKGIAFNVPMYYIHRYLRLTPSYAVGALISATLLRYVGSGPFWSHTELTVQQPCREYWWSSLLYIQNFVDISKQCGLATWHLNVDMQLFYISPLLFIPMWKRPKTTLVGVCILIIASISLSLAMALKYELYGLPMNLHGFSREYLTKYYNEPLCRATPWLIGVLLGYGLYDIKIKKNSFHFGRITNVVLWALALTVLFYTVFAGHYSTLRNQEYEKWGSALYIAFIRPLWTLGVAWVIFACVVGYGGPISRFLSFPIFGILSNLTYSIYLVHYPLFRMLAYSRKVPVLYSQVDILHQFLGNYCLTVGIAVIWALAFEYPMITIQKHLFKDTAAPGKKEAREKEHTH